MPEPEENLLLSAEGVDQTVVLDEDDCFEPVLPPPMRTTPKPDRKPKTRSFGRLIDEVYRELGVAVTPTSTPRESEHSALEADVATDDAHAPQPTENPGAPTDTQPPPPRVATATEIVSWIKRALLAQTHLSEHEAELIALWTLSTWHQQSLTVLPCLVITGPAHDARRVLHVLKQFCMRPALVAGFGRSHLDALRHCCTNLISEPNLDKRTASLLSSLTDGKSLVVAGAYLACYSKSTAIYAGENPETHKIENSIHIHLTPTATEPTASPEWLQTMIERVPVHLNQYRDKNLVHILYWPWDPSGLSSEMATVATELGRCIVDAPELQLKLVALLKLQEKKRLSDISSTIEAVVLEATLNLGHEGKQELLVGEIATEVNRIVTARGERLSYNPEKIGHSLKKMGRTTRRLGAAGKGLVMDRVTIARVHELATVYGGVGLDQGENNLTCPFCNENEGLM